MPNLHEDNNNRTALLLQPSPKLVEYSPGMPLSHCRSDTSDYDSDTSLDASDYSCSCCDDVVGDKQQQQHDASVQQKTTRSVRFDPHLYIREFNLTVGDAPTCADSCPLTLDWSYCCYYSTSCGDGGPSVNDDDHHETTTTTTWDPCPTHQRRRTAQYYRFYQKQKHNPCRRRRQLPPRLSLEERRQRIAMVRGWSRDQVRALELERVLERLGQRMLLLRRDPSSSPSPCRCHDANDKNTSNSSSSSSSSSVLSPSSLTTSPEFEDIWNNAEEEEEDEEDMDLHHDDDETMRHRVLCLR